MTQDQKLGNKLKKQIQEIYSAASEKTEEYARVGKKRLDILSLSRDVAREKKILGERVYELSRRPASEPVLEDVTVKAILARLQNLEAEMKNREAEIGAIREEARAARERRESQKTAEEARPGESDAAVASDRPGAPEPPVSPEENGDGEAGPKPKSQAGASDDDDHPVGI